MARRAANVDEYIERAPEHARPVLRELRARVHAVCPAAEESIKWGMPSFSYHGIIGSMAAFKGHCSFSFWKAGLLTEDGGREVPGLNRISDVSELLPPREFERLLRRAMELNEKGVKAPRSRPAARRPEPEVPEDMMTALRADPRALRAFQAFSPSARREYVEWITGAKREATRQRRLQQAVEWIADGKPRHWKYE